MIVEYVLHEFEKKLFDWTIELKQIIGGVILGIGIWVKVDKSNLFELMGKIKLDDTAASFSSTNSSILNTMAIVLIVLGTFTFVTGFCGCCGAIKESQCLLYIVIMTNRYYSIDIIDPYYVSVCFPRRYRRNSWSRNWHIRRRQTIRCDSQFFFV